MSVLDERDDVVRITRTLTARARRKTVKVCYDQYNRQIRCPKRSLGGGKLGAIIACAIIAALIITLIIIFLYRRKKAKQARAAGGGTPVDVEKSTAPLAYTHSADVNNAPAMSYNSPASDTGYQVSTNTYQPSPVPNSYQPPGQTAYQSGYAPNTYDTQAPTQGYNAGYQNLNYGR
ncbi:hypothetical protein CC85DRAFT_325975 [Cutaneotrichosporon oleaginosum]|uniref:Uncharacterized protein n=1 Tax=Cutaneotrichosporon oleaginosum TaxID=879819 RepID=A0A0J0XVF9_9TREE|nr:uncharacterized protein CC85DRAFT_325975 [Cutaneotrichosporon oleaginosum]KLT45060.1 hypothetical protein CC85DRAFT_325975 [Cutaneotrichosporon oleaginosum]TXT09744.1 hypothetical protein COLE_03678 [Cutaneotrichosporon oleaginosum]